MHFFIQKEKKFWIFVFYIRELIHSSTDYKAFCIVPGYLILQQCFCKNFFLQLILKTLYLGYYTFKSFLKREKGYYNDLINNNINNNNILLGTLGTISMTATRNTLR